MKHPKEHVSMQTQPKKLEVLLERIITNTCNHSRISIMITPEEYNTFRASLLKALMRSLPDWIARERK